jgi:hypothetical protein
VRKSLSRARLASPSVPRPRSRPLASPAPVLAPRARSRAFDAFRITVSRRRARLRVAVARRRRVDGRANGRTVERSLESNPSLAFASRPRHLASRSRFRRTLSSPHSRSRASTARAFASTRRVIAPPASRCAGDGAPNGYIERVK